MEKRLHPIFNQNANQQNAPKIQTQFDPTPQGLTQNLAVVQKPMTTNTGNEANEYYSEAKLKINRLSQKVTGFEERMDLFSAEVRTAYSKIAGKLNERIQNENKIEAMVQRHNQMVNAFETRLTQLSKVIADSQSQLIATQGALEDARREIARLKKL